MRAAFVLTRYSRDAVTQRHALLRDAVTRDGVTLFRFGTVTARFEARRFDVEILDRLRGLHQRRQVVDHGDLEHLTASGDDRVVPTACLERIFTPSMRSQDSVPFSAFSKISRVSMATLVSKLDV
jgi:hypothetical protein